MPDNNVPITDLTSDQYIEAINRGDIAPNSMGQAVGMQRLPSQGLLQRLMQMLMMKKKQPKQQARLQSLFLG